MDEKNIGTILKQLRQKKGLTQKDIAKSLIITPQTISKWENGLSSPSLEMMVALSEIYDVSVDELLKGTKENNDVTVIKEKGKLQYSIALYVMLGIMVAFGILTLFFDFAEIWVTKIQLTESSALHVYPTYYIIDENVSLVMAVIMIASPVLIGILSTLDRNKFSSLLISNIVLIYFVSVLSKYMGHPEFSEPRLGLIFVLIFVVFLIITICLQLVLSKSDIVKKISDDKATLTFGIVAYIIATILPFTYGYVNYYEHWENPFIDVFTYFETLDQVIVLLMMILGSMVLISSYNAFKKATTTFSLLMIIVLLWTTIVYIFNSGLILPSLLMYAYILVLGTTFKKEDFKFFKATDFPLSILTILEIIAIGFYIYLLTLDGDLFFNYDGPEDLEHTIRNSNFKYGSLIALHFILLVVPMFFRFVKLHKTSIAFYTVWAVYEAWFLIDIYNTYIKVGYRMTDGMLYFIPPILLGLYGTVRLIILIIQSIQKEQETENLITE